PSRVDLSFQKTNCNQVDLHFSLRLPDLLQRRTAYLSQSVPFKDCDDALRDLVFIDEVRFSLVGTFHHNPVKCITPVYLFVPPIPVELVNNIYCIRYPPPDALFFWSSDPDGQNVIDEEDWEAYGISQLEIFTWIGSSWHYERYVAVQDHLLRKNCSLDGKQYARDHGYSESQPFELIEIGDPHSPSIMVLEELNSLEGTDSADERLEHPGQFCCSPRNEANNPGDNDHSVSFDPSCNELGEIHQDEADKIRSGAVASSPIGGTHEGPKPRLVHDLSPSRRSSQSQQNKYQPPGWPRAIYELLVLVWSIAVVVLSIGFDRARRVVRGTRRETMDVVVSLVETKEDTINDRQISS
ncbi:hypothetical protein PQX77_003669, partial [Marasmius sp. AFHP31]